jgi:hypothetical protein
MSPCLLDSLSVVKRGIAVAIAVVVAAALLAAGVWGQALAWAHQRHISVCPLGSCLWTGWSNSEFGLVLVASGALIVAAAIVLYRLIRVWRGTAPARGFWAHLGL